MSKIPSGSINLAVVLKNYACANPGPKPEPYFGRRIPSKVPEKTDTVSIAASSSYSCPLFTKRKDSSRSALSSSTISRKSIRKTL